MQFFEKMWWFKKPGCILAWSNPKWQTRRKFLRKKWRRSSRRSRSTAPMRRRYWCQEPCTLLDPESRVELGPRNSQYSAPAALRRSAPRRSSGRRGSTGTSLGPRLSPPCSSLCSPTTRFSAPWTASICRRWGWRRYHRSRRLLRGRDRKRWISNPELESRGQRGNKFWDPWLGLNSVAGVEKKKEEADWPYRLPEFCMGKWKIYTKIAAGNYRNGLVIIYSHVNG